MDSQQPKALRLAEWLQSGADDPMWSDHTEMPKSVAAHAAAELRRLYEENREFKTVMIAAAEEIAARWDAHCDSEGYGPANLMRRLEQGIPSEYGYTAGAFAKLKAVNALSHRTMVQAHPRCGHCCPQRQPQEYAAVAIEHCLSARNERTPCPHTVATPAAIQSDLKWAVKELEELDDATVQVVIGVLRKHLVTPPPAAQRQPLTDEQIVQLSLEWPAETNDWASHIDFARAIEAAHGITGERK